MNELFDPVRLRTVAATPEELVRQDLLQRMIHGLGYPKGLLAVEKELGATQRRADIICYTASCVPLLLIECKAEDGSLTARAQAMGYNSFLEAPFVAIAGKTEISTFWFDGKKISSVPFLPAYRDLLEQAGSFLR